jgi:hypothetical protein
MTGKQLQALISAGVFSAALLSGAAYADDSSANANSNGASAPATTPTNGQDPSTTKGSDQTGTASADQPNQQNQKQTTSTDKSAAQHGCSGAGGCSGK